MANTYTLIASSTVGSGGAASIQFTSIPSTYTDLLIKISARCDVGQTSIDVRFNSATTNRSSRYLYGSGSAAASGSDTTYMYIVSALNPSSYTANTFGNGELYIPNYTSSNYKSSSSDGVDENNATAAYMSINANLWSNTSAITQIDLLPAGSGNFVQYSTAYLYGIKSS